MIKIASMCLWLSGIGFGIPCIYGIRSMLQGKGIAYVMGYPSYGNGPLEKIGVHTTVPLLIGFLLVCTLECIAGWSLWNAGKDGAVLSFALIPLEMFYFIGFALPFGPPLILIRIIFLLLSWSALR